MALYPGSSVLRREAERALGHLGATWAQLDGEELILCLVVVSFSRRGGSRGHLVQGGDAAALVLVEQVVRGILRHGTARRGAVEEGEGGDCDIPRVRGEGVTTA